jgi:hypothetical protein
MRSKRQCRRHPLDFSIGDGNKPKTMELVPPPAPLPTVAAVVVVVATVSIVHPLCRAFGMVTTRNMQTLHLRALATVTIMMKD